VVRTFHSVTLEVTPRSRKRSRWPRPSARSALTLRSLADNQTDLDRAIASGSLKLPAGATKADEDRALAASSRQPGGYRGHVTTGGEVSRFQKRTMSMTPAHRARARLARRGSRSHRPQRARDARFVTARAFPIGANGLAGAGRGAGNAGSAIGATMMAN
jgi:pilus assembly protein CpaB